jgi:hypothetical protein
VSFVHDAIIEGFDVRNEATDQLEDVGLFRHDRCLHPDDDHPCYRLALNEVTLDKVAAAHNRGIGLDSGDLLLDFIFTKDNRDELADDDGGQVFPGRDFFKTIATRSPALPDEAFFLPDLATTDDPITPSGATFGVRAFCCNTVTFAPQGGGDDPPPPAEARDFGAVCDIFTAQEVVDGPRAVGSDGTQYVVVSVGSAAVPATADRSLCPATRWVLEAHYRPSVFQGSGALGPVRWSIALPTPDGLEPGGECQHENVRCDVSTNVVPQPDGSVQIETVTTKVAGGVDGTSLDEEVLFGAPPEGDPSTQVGVELCCPAPVVLDDGTPTTLGTVRAWVDASGHPGFLRPEATKVADFSATAVTADASGRASLDPCAIAPSFGCGLLPDGHTAQWLFGDGTTSDAVGGTVAAQTHRYPHTPGSDPFLGILVHYDENHEVVDKAYFRVTA